MYTIDTNRKESQEVCLPIHANYFDYFITPCSILNVHMCMYINASNNDIVNIWYVQEMYIRWLTLN